MFSKEDAAEYYESKQHAKVKKFIEHGEHYNSELKDIIIYRGEVMVMRESKGKPEPKEGMYNGDEPPWL